MARPSSSRVSNFHDVPRYLYEEWIHAEAQLYIFRDPMRVGTISKVVLEDARIKTRGARVACGYYLATPKVSEGEEDAGVDQIEEDAWYEDEYPDGDGDGEGVDGDGLGDQADGAAGPGGD